MYFEDFIDADVGLPALGCRVDILGTNCDRILLIYFGRGKSTCVKNTNRCTSEGIETVFHRHSVFVLRLVI